MKTTWFCAVMAIRFSEETKGDNRATRITPYLAPFGVEAENYYEALGMASAIMERVRLDNPDFGNWSVRLNKLGARGLVADPKNLSTVADKDCPV